MSVAKPFWLSPRGIRVVGDWSQMLKKAICLGFVKNAEMMVAIVTKGMNMHRTFSVRWTGRDGQLAQEQREHCIAMIDSNGARRGNRGIVSDPTRHLRRAASGMVPFTFHVLASIMVGCTRMAWTV